MVGLFALQAAASRILHPDRAGAPNPQAASGGAGVRLALRLALGALAVYAALFVVHALRMITSPGELNYAEGLWIFAAIRIRHGLSPYFDYSHAPYIPLTYPPVAPALAAGVGALGNLPDTALAALSRGESLLAALAGAGAIFVLVRALGAGRLPAATAALLFLTPPYTFSLWSFVARGDLPALALGLGAVAMLARRPTPAGLLAGGVLAGLALATKQTAVAPALAGVSWLLVPERRQGLPWLLGGIALGGGGPLLALGGDNLALLLRGTVDLAGQPWAIGPLSARLTDLFELAGPLIPLALAGAAWPAAAPGPRGLIGRYTVLAALALLVTGGKIGSASSYCLELIAVLAILAGLGLAWLLALGPLPREIGPGLALLALTPLLIQTGRAFQQAQTVREPRIDDRALRAAIPGSGPLLSENSYILLHGPDPPVLIDPLFFSVEATLGRWDPAPVRQMVEQRRFTAVVLFHPLTATPWVQGVPWLPDSIRQAVTQYYHFATMQGRYYVYLPNAP